MKYSDLVYDYYCYCIAKSCRRRGERFDFALKEETFNLKATRASSPCMHGLAEMEHFFLKEWEQ